MGEQRTAECWEKKLVGGEPTNQPPLKLEKNDHEGEAVTKFYPKKDWGGELVLDRGRKNQHKSTT